jgi:hypothetical protein
MLGREDVVAAVGAAHHVLAEEHASSANRLRPPHYTGPATHEGVEAFLKTRVAKWAKEKQEAIAAATAEFVEVSKVEPVAPPRWVVAAHTRVGELNAELADQMMSLSLPDALAESEAERTAFEKALRESSEPVLAAARTAFENCVQLSERYHLSDGEREYCQERLNGLPLVE